MDNIYKQDDMYYADDLALLFNTQDHMQEIIRKLKRYASMIGLKVDVKKTYCVLLERKQFGIVVPSNFLEDRWS